MTYLEHREPRDAEIVKSEIYDITRGGAPWNPQSAPDSDGQENRTHRDHSDDIHETNDENDLRALKASKTKGIGEDIQINIDACIQHLDITTSELSFRDPNPGLVADGKPAQLHRALPSKLDYGKLSKYFLYRPKDVIQMTLQQTTQLAKAICTGWVVA